MKNRLLSNQLFTVLVALLAGSAAIFAFAPFGFWPVQILCLTAFFLLILIARSTLHSLFIGWAFGFGWALCGVYWLFVSMHRYGGMPAPLAALAVVLLALYLGAFSAITSITGYTLINRWSATRAQASLLILPALWVLTEWLRGWLFTGFPWVASGYAHTNGPLAGYAPLIGVYGISLLAALVAGSLIAALHPKEPEQFWIAILGACILVVGNMLNLVTWTTPSGAPLRVRLLQGNVPQEMKFSPTQIDATLNQYQKLIRMEPVDLVVTPETAIPLYLHELPPEYFKVLTDYVETSGSAIAMGIPYADPRPFYANSLVVISPHEQAKAKNKLYRYDKHHLVPFGEFVPPGFAWFVNLMNIPLGDFHRGDLLQAPFPVKDQWVTPNICYEDLFGEEIAARIAHAHKEGTPEPAFMLNLSNIAWFGNTLALPQHLQISQMRALEMGRPMLRATNTGATAIIDHKGKVLDRLPYFTEGTLTAPVQGYKGITPYIKLGNSSVIILAILLLIFAKVRTRNARNVRNEPLV